MDVGGEGEYKERTTTTQPMKTILVLIFLRQVYQPRRILFYAPAAGLLGSLTGLGDVKWFQSAALVKRYRSVNDYYLDLCLENVTKVESTPRSWRRRRSYGINMYNEYNFFNPIHNLWFILERALGDRSKPWSECCLSGLIQFTVQCIEISRLPAKCSLPCLDL